jgi:hypothetical protein
MPTLDAILDLRSGDVVAARQRALDDDLQRFVAGNPSAPPLAGVAPSTPNRGKPPR